MNATAATITPAPLEPAQADEPPAAADQPRCIYLDYNATTPLDPRVLEAMMPHLTHQFANPSSAHAAGKAAKAAVERARQQVADLIGADAGEIIFTGGGSEANNMALKGLAAARRHLGHHIITSAVEHPSVTNVARYLERNGFSVTYLPVDSFGRIDPADLKRAITPATILISIMHSNNEIGTVQPIEAVAELARSRGILLHTDASQSAGKLPLDVRSLRVDALTLAGHKMYGPKGVAALYVRRGVNVEPLIHGSGHESGRRAGTENVPAIVGLGAACALAADELARGHDHLQRLRDYLYEQLRAIFGERLARNGHPTECAPSTLNISIAGWTGQKLLAAIPEMAASTGSACHAGSNEPSPVLRAMGVEPWVAAGAVRLSLGRWTTREEIDQVLELMRRRLEG